LLHELKGEWQGKIIISPDCDESGEKMASGVSGQLKKAGYEVQVLGLNGGMGFDLGDFCTLHRESSTKMFFELDELVIHPDNKRQKISHGLESDLTDLHNAVRLVRQAGNYMKWVFEWGWITWNGKKWEKDHSAKSMSFCKKTARSINREADIASDSGASNRAKNLAKWARQSSNRTKLEAMLKLAECELAARPDQFDIDPYLLNGQNGILDLRNGKFSPHDPNANITQLAGTGFDPAATYPRWEKFVQQIFDYDQALISFIQRAVGYSLTGSVDEQVLLFLYGTGANGKTTFLQAIIQMLGDYAKQAAPQLTMMGDRHPAEIADLYGARFVATIEVEQGRRMAEVLVKQLTGGDLIKARYMRKNWFEFEPTFKIWLAANHKPIIRGTDHAIWRRIRLIPFNVTIPEEDQDRQLGDKLKDELPGILNWALQGCLDWQANGLKTSGIMREAVSEYRGEMDLLASFIKDQCLTGPRYEARSKYLYQAFTQWCTENGEKAWSQRTFGLRLRERGFNKKRTGAGVVWLGIGLPGSSGNAQDH